MNKKLLVTTLLIAFFIGALGSVFFNRVLFPSLSSVRGFEWVGKLQSSSPVVINRREEVRLNEGVNLIELTKQAQTVVVSVYSQGGDARLLGNGLIISSDGIIFTTRDVVGANTAVNIVTNDGMLYEGLVRAMDTKSPLAVVTITGRDMPVAQFSDASNMQIAQRVFALGKTTQEFTRQFASGLVTKTVSNTIDYNRVLSTERFENTLQTEADLDADYIGGPVVNLQGLIVGVVIGVNGEILPAEAIDGALKTYLENGKISRPYIGLNYQMITKTVAKVKNLPASGVSVVTVEPNSPAAKAGLIAGDVITKINDQTVADSSLEQVLLQQSAPQLKIALIRGTQQVELTLNVETR